MRGARLASAACASHDHSHGVPESQLLPCAGRPRTQIHMLKATPLHCAAMGGHVAVAERLLAANPSLVGVRDAHGKTPAKWAARHGHAALAEKLRGLEPPVRRNQGKAKYQVAPAR